MKKVKNYGHISCIANHVKQRVIDGQYYTCQEKKMVEVAERFNFMGFGFIVHKAILSSGWTASEEFSGLAASSNNGLSSIKKAIEVAKENTKKFIDTYGIEKLEEKIRFSRKILTANKSRYITLKLKNIV